jgi:hypothetical protein
MKCVGVQSLVYFQNRNIFLNEYIFYKLIDVLCANAVAGVVFLLNFNKEYLIKMCSICTLIWPQRWIKFGIWWTVYVTY